MSPCAQIRLHRVAVDPEISALSTTLLAHENGFARWSSSGAGENARLTFDAPTTEVHDERFVRPLSYGLHSFGEHSAWGLHPGGHDIESITPTSQGWALWWFDGELANGRPLRHYPTAESPLRPTSAPTPNGGLVVWWMDELEFFAVDGQSEHLVPLPELSEPLFRSLRGDTILLLDPDPESRPNGLCHPDCTPYNLVRLGADGTLRWRNERIWSTWEPPPQVAISPDDEVAVIWEENHTGDEHHFESHFHTIVDWLDASGELQWRVDVGAYDWTVAHRATTGERLRLVAERRWEDDRDDALIVLEVDASGVLCKQTVELEARWVRWSTGWASDDQLWLYGGDPGVGAPEYFDEDLAIVVGVRW